MTPFLALVGRDLTLAWREGAGIGTALGFYLVVVAMLPLGLGPDMALLARIAPGMLWVAMLLAALLSVARLFEADRDDGSLEALALGPLPLEQIALAKALAHWISTGIPLVAMAPLFGLLLNLDVATYPRLLLTMLAGTPAISFIGAVGAALTLGARKSGLLVAMIVLPLYVPTLVFGIGAVGLAGEPGTGPALAVLTAISLGAVVLAPFAAAAALRYTMQ